MKDWTPRETLAAMAMQGILASCANEITINPDTIANAAFAVADAMIKRGGCKTVCETEPSVTDAQLAELVGRGDRI